MIEFWIRHYLLALRVKVIGCCPHGHTTHCHSCGPILW